MRRQTAILSILILLLSTLQAPNVQARPEPWSLRVVEADARHLTVELFLSVYDSQTMVHEGTRYQRPSVGEWSNWGQPGQPQLPMHSVLLGMPRPGQAQVTVVEADSHIVTGQQLYPVPSLELREAAGGLQVVEAFTIDPQTYNADTVYPGVLAEVADSGFLRDQLVFQLRLYPFQYNPLRQELRIYRRLKILVTFPEPHLLSGASLSQPSHAFEQILRRTVLNYDTLPRASPEPVRSPITTLSHLDGGPQVKLYVEQSGLYRVTHDDVFAVAPVLTQGNPRHLQLSNQGSAIPLQFYGEMDGTFDPGDSFSFYGQAIRSDYTRHNVYWLSDLGVPGLRMVERDGTPGEGDTPTTFPQRRRYEQDNLCQRDVPGGEGQDHWFWHQLSVSSSTPTSEGYAFDLHHIATGGPGGELRVMLQGATPGDHATQLYINGVALLSPEEQAWSGSDEKLYTVPISQSLLEEGTNILQVSSYLPAGESNSAFYVNWYEVTYQDTYVAEDDHLSFSVPSAGSYAFEVTGFSTRTVEIFDVTTPAAPVRIVNQETALNGSSYGLYFSDDAGTGQQYVAQRPDQVPTPPLQLDEPSAWKSTANGATYLIITHPSFYAAVQPLAAHRSNQGETSVTVKTEDVYDEFNGGICDPHAIRSFLQYTYQYWSPRPVYVLLVGDASLDPKNNRGTSLPDLVPAHYVDTLLLGQAPNDNWYAKVHGDDDYPDLIVGRIPARSNSDVTAVVDKVQAYERSPLPGDWTQRAILVADDDEATFTEDMDTVAGMLPEHIAAIRMVDYDPTTSVRNEVGAGALLLAYSGHGNVQWWGRWDGHWIFRQSQMPGLGNGDRLPFMIVANCLNGLYDEYDTPRAMAEEFLLLSDEGGIASWAPASYGFPTTNSLILRELNQALWIDRDLILGSAATTARIQAHLRRPDLPLSLFEIFTYFGDPAVQLSFSDTLALDGQDLPDPVLMGERLTYTLVYTVSQVNQSLGLTLSDALPQEVIYQSASPSPSSIDGQNLTWNLGNTPAGTYTATLTALVKISGQTHGHVLQNHAQLYDQTGGDQVLDINTTVHDVPITGLWVSNDGPTQLGESTTVSVGTTAGTNVAYNWELGDGHTAAGAHLSHTYPATGTYSVTVTATNGVGQSTASTIVTIVDWDHWLFLPLIF